MAMRAGGKQRRGPPSNFTFLQSGARDDRQTGRPNRAGGDFTVGGNSKCAGAGTKSLRHGVIEPKGDAGFSLMVGQRGFAEKHGLKLEIVALKNGATAHKALLAGELDSIESSPGSAILAGAHGADIKILGCDWPGVPHGL